MQTIHLDVSVKPNMEQNLLVITAKQGDIGRKIKAVITDCGEDYKIPSDAVLTAWYSGTSGSGNYSEIDGKSAFELSENTIIVELITQMLTNKGGGVLCLILHNADGAQLGLWDIPYVVEGIPGMNSVGAEQCYTALSEFTQRAVKSAAKAAEAAATFETDTTLTLSGKAADAAAVSRVSTPYNLLDNSDFRNPVNQRGKLHYTSGYTIDRWFQGVNFSVDVTDEGVAISDASQAYGAAFRQKVLWDRSDVPVTFAVCDSDGFITVVSGIPRSEWTLASREWGNIGFQCSNNMIIANIRVDYGYNRTFRWAALYEGVYTVDTLPKYKPKGYGAELVECQRYFKVYNNPCVPCGNSSAGTQISGYILGGMRVNPTVILTNMYFFLSAGSYMAIDSATALSEDGGIIITFYLASTVSVNSSGISAGGSITLSADL